MNTRTAPPNTHPIKLTKRNLFKKLDAIHPKTRYLLLGESTHGTAEFFEWRLFITKYMVTHHDYNTVLFEMEWPLGYQLNLYIHSKINQPLKPFLRSLFTSFPRWIGNNKYIFQLITFLKKWNDNPSHRRVYFYGVDCQDPDLAKKHLDQCQDKSLHCPIIRKIIDNYAHMIQSPNYWNARDTFWLYIINSIKTHRSSKFILWAHNSHIGNNQANLGIGDKINIGVLLKKTYQAYHIGFSTHHGTVRASKQWNTKSKSMILRAAHKDSWESQFKSIAQKMDTNAIIYTCSPQKPEPKPLLFRYVGVIYRPDQEMTSHYQKTNLDKEYNLVLFFTKTYQLPSLLRGSAKGD